MRSERNFKDGRIRDAFKAEGRRHLFESKHGTLGRADSPVSQGPELRFRVGWVLGVLLGCVAISGCISKSRADAQARAAFTAGQTRGLQMAFQENSRGPVVRVLGNVKNAMVPWTPDLTLAKAIVAAQYHGPGDPASIILIHNGQAKEYDPKQLLAGEDVPLEPMDIVQINR